jgi:UPF0176 protein
MKEYQILLFYKYVHLEDPAVVRDWVFGLCQKYNIKGRLIVAAEGINFTFEGKTADTEAFLIEMQQDQRFHNIHFKRSHGTGEAFPKLSVKVREEIVTGNLGVCDIDPNEVTGKHLPPATLHEWIHGAPASAEDSGVAKEFYIIDMRNAYEHKVGKFADSICPPLDNFRDLPKIIESIAHLKNKTVVTVCTGGVRCEKASGYLITQGFTDVYQLDGGIVSYMEMYPNEDFEGKLYVFDRRLMLGFYTDDPKHKVIGTCDHCGKSSEQFINCANKECNRHMILCDNCQAVTIAKHSARVCMDECLSSKKKGSSKGLIWGKIKALWNR